MFSRFNLSGLTEEFFGGKDACEKYQSHYKDCVLPLMDSDDHLMGSDDHFFRKYLEHYLQPNGNLDSSKMEDEWFQSVSADVFLSHSHLDETLVEGFAGWLHECCGVVAFVDSSLWGYADDLLKDIDNAYCKNNDAISYNYKLRNASTSRVHMILMTALAKMIDKTECLIFVNTPRSISIEDSITKKNKTLSPWIYSELALSRIIRRQQPPMYRSLTEFSHVDESNSIPMEFTAPIEHLDTLTIDNLTDWKQFMAPYIKLRDRGFPISARQSLDYLYKLLLSSEVLHG